MTNDHLISSQSLNLGGRRGTTDDVATIPFHPSLSSATLRESPNPIPVHSLMLSSHLFFGSFSFFLLSLSPAELSELTNDMILQTIYEYSGVTCVLDCHSQRICFSNLKRLRKDYFSNLADAHGNRYEGCYIIINVHDQSHF